MVLEEDLLADGTRLVLVSDSFDLAYVAPRSDNTELNLCVPEVINPSHQESVEQLVPLRSLGD